MSSRATRTARELLQLQLDQLGEFRNAGARSPVFRAWRQSTLTVIQRVWPGDGSRSERFRRIPFSAPSTRAEAKEMRDWYERGCSEAAALLQLYVEEAPSGDAARAPVSTAPANDGSPGLYEDDFPMLDLPGGAPRPAPAKPAPPAAAKPAPKPVAPVTPAKSAAPPPPPAPAPQAAAPKPAAPVAPVSMPTTPPAPAAIPAASIPKPPTPMPRAAQPAPGERRDARPNGAKAKKAAKKAARRLKDMLGFGEFDAPEDAAPIADASDPSPPPSLPRPTYVGPIDSDLVTLPASHPTPIPPPPPAPSVLASPRTVPPSLEAALASLTASDASPVAGPGDESELDPILEDVPAVAAENRLPTIDSLVPPDFADALQHSIEDHEPVEHDDPEPARPRAEAPVREPQAVRASIDDLDLAFEDSLSILPSHAVTPRAPEDDVREEPLGEAPAGGLPRLELVRPESADARRGAPAHASDPNEPAAPAEEIEAPSSAAPAAAEASASHPDFRSPAARGLQALASEVARLGVPEGHRARARATLLDLARRVDEDALTWDEMRDAVVFAMEFPPLAQRLVPMLLPYFDAAA